MLALGTLTAEEYYKLRYKFIKQVEESGHEDPTIYVDGKGIVSMGVGFNATDRDVLRVILRDGFGINEGTGYKAGKTALDLQNAIVALTKTVSTTAGLSGLQSKLDKLMVEYTNDKKFFKFESAPAGGKTAIEKIRETFDALAPSYEEKLSDFLIKHGYSDGTTEINNNKITNMNYSAERLALFSLAYNSPKKLLGDGLGAALSNDNRAKAWFEIRYGSNKLSPDSNGVAKRRYMESQIFGLYSDPTNASDKEAQDILKVYLDSDNKINPKIKSYEASYQKMIDDANNELVAVGIKGKDPTKNLTVDSIGQIFKPIANYIYDKYTLKADLQANVDNHGLIDFRRRMTGDVVLGYETQGGSDDVAFIQPIYRWLYNQSPPNEVNLPAGITGINDMLVALDDKAYSLQGLYGNDILIGGEKDDKLYGGYKNNGNNSGDDVLIGGDGNDDLYSQDGSNVLRGGKGVDNYYIDVGAFNRIIDEDSQGKIYIEQTAGKKD